MNTSQDIQNYRLNDPEWYFLAEFPLDKLPAGGGDELKAGLLFHAISGLGTDPEILNNLERKLIGLAREALAQRTHGRTAAPAYIRLFLQKKVIEETILMRSSIQFENEQARKSTQNVNHSDREINGGWGYFLVERGGVIPNDASASNCNWVDLYLYKEGE